jgi:hypothetical protein
MNLPPVEKAGGKNFGYYSISSNLLPYKITAMPFEIAHSLRVFVHALSKRQLIRRRDQWISKKRVLYNTCMASPIPPAIAKIAPDGNLSPRQKRRFMIDILKRRVRPGAGSSVDFMRRRTGMNPWPDLRPILQGLDWVIVGGVATRSYMPERMTQDLDVLVHREDGEAAIAKLERAGYHIVSRLAIPGCSLRSPEGTEVDVIFGDYPWLRNALAHPAKDPAGYPVIALPYLILLKMAAQRARDLGDLGTMLGWASDADLSNVRAVVAQYTPEDSEDLESLIFIGRQERQSPPNP